MKIIKGIKERLNKKELVIPLAYKPGDPVPEYPKTSYGLFRHYNLELSHLTDDEIEELLKENSDSVQEDYIKAEAWDKLVEKLNQNVGNAEAEHMLMEMQHTYTEVEKDFN